MARFDEDHSPQQSPNLYQEHLLEWSGYVTKSKQSTHEMHEVDKIQIKTASKEMFAQQYTEHAWNNMEQDINNDVQLNYKQKHHTNNWCIRRQFEDSNTMIYSRYTKL